jgi:hypothetical protein
VFFFLTPTRVPREGEAAFGSGRVTDKAWRADKTIAGGE